MRNRRISWAAAMREMQQERARRSGVREERLRATAGLRGTFDLTSWRGRSGRRYVVGVHPLDATALCEVTEAVVIAVKRDGEGRARVIDAAAAGPQFRCRAGHSWVSRASARGATEMHIHRLAEDEGERQAIVDDLVQPDDAEPEAFTSAGQDARGPGP